MVVHGSLCWALVDPELRHIEREMSEIQHGVKHDALHESVTESAPESRARKSTERDILLKKEAKNDR